MVDPVGLTVLGVAALLLGLAVWGILYVGYQAYLARLAKEARAALPADAVQDPLAQLREVNADIAGAAREASDAAQRARDAVRHGIKG